MVDHKMTEDPDFPIVEVGKSTRARGADLLFAGALTFGAAFLFTMLAPIALVGYGAFRIFARKSKKEGFLFIGLGAATYFLLKFFAFLFFLPKLAGILMMGAGLMMIFKRKGNQE